MTQPRSHIIRAVFFLVVKVPYCAGVYIEPGPSDREFTHTFVLFYFFCAKGESFKLESVASSSSYSLCCCCRDRERGCPKEKREKTSYAHTHTQCPFGRAVGGYGEDTLAAGHVGSCERVCGFVLLQFRRSVASEKGFFGSIAAWRGK